jgi:type II secretory ATPase GspE/PulE/Tfp pilus assembly ATPase PilB-like protein
MTFAGAIAQTLIPVVCPKCALKKHPDKTVDKRFRELFGGNLRFRNKNSSGCTCTNGLEKRSQVVAEVYPLCAAKDKAYQLIRDGKYDDLATYMENEEGVESMRQIAADRVRRGIFDPEIVIERIGFFDPKGSWRKNNA